MNAGLDARAFARVGFVMGIATLGFGCGPQVTLDGGETIGQAETSDPPTSAGVTSASTPPATTDTLPGTLTADEGPLEESGAADDSGSIADFPEQCSILLHLR